MTLKEIFNNFKNRFKSRMLKSYAFAEKNSYIAVRITGNLKTLVESKIVTTIVDITPTEIDNRILPIVRRVVPKVAFKIALIHEFMKSTDNPKEAVAALIVFLKTLTVDARADFWIRFSAELTIALSDGKLTLTEGLILSQMAYKELYENK